TMKPSGKQPFPRGIRLVPFLVLTVLLAGCTNKDITKANYDKIKVGMTLKQVEAIIGPPDVAMQGNGCRGCTIAGIFRREGQCHIVMDPGKIEWMENHKTITLKFKYGRVTHKEQSGLQ